MSRASARRLVGMIFATIAQAIGANLAIDGKTELDVVL
jgi:hypothetical protein